MCLFTIKDTPQKTDSPIKCMKLVRKVVDENGKVEYRSLYSVLHGFIRYTVGERAEMIRNGKDEPGKVLEKKIRKSVIGAFPKYNNTVHEGLHTFIAEYNDWERVAMWAVIYYDDWKLALLECEIPAGTEYCYGMHNCLSYTNGERGYTSEYLDVIREMDIDWSEIKEKANANLLKID